MRSHWKGSVSLFTGVKTGSEELSHLHKDTQSESWHSLKSTQHCLAAKLFPRHQTGAGLELRFYLSTARGGGSSNITDSLRLSRQRIQAKVREVDVGRAGFAPAAERSASPTQENANFSPAQVCLRANANGWARRAGPIRVPCTCAVAPCALLPPSARSARVSSSERPRV